MVEQCGSAGTKRLLQVHSRHWLNEAIRLLCNQFEVAQAESASTIFTYFAGLSFRLQIEVLQAPQNAGHGPAGPSLITGPPRITSA